MNILMVADVSIAKVIGGAERVLYEQAMRLADRGHSVHILTRLAPEHDSERGMIGNVSEWRYEVDLTSGLSYLKSTLKNGGDLFESLQEEIGFDCLNFHQPFSAYAVLKRAGSSGIRKVYTCHSLIHEEFVTRNPYPNGVLQKLSYHLKTYVRKYIEKKCLSASDSIVVLSDYTRNKLIGSHEITDDKIHIIPGGVDLERFKPIADKASIRDRFNIPQGKTILFTVRNLVPRMGLNNLVKAMQELKHHSSDLFLIIGGSGPLREELESLCKKYELDEMVRMVGFIPEDDLPLYHGMADIFVLATQDLEGFGLITLEAMASGVPVLGTPVGGTQEILTRFNKDFLFTDSTPQAMADLILTSHNRIKADPEEWEHVSLHAREFIEKYYSWERNVDQLLSQFS